MKSYNELKIRNRIYQYRKSSNLSQEKLSKKMSTLSLSRFSKIEGGQIAPTNFASLIEISEALGVSIDDLLVDCLEYYDNPDSDFSIDTEIETMIKSLCSKNEHIIALINLCNTIISSREKN